MDNSKLAYIAISSDTSSAQIIFWGFAVISAMGRYNDDHHLYHQLHRCGKSRVEEHDCSFATQNQCSCDSDERDSILSPNARPWYAVFMRKWEYIIEILNWYRSDTFHIQYGVHFIYDFKFSFCKWFANRHLTIISKKQYFWSATHIFRE